MTSTLTIGKCLNADGFNNNIVPYYKESVLLKHWSWVGNDEQINYPQKTWFEMMENHPEDVFYASWVIFSFEKSSNENTKAFRPLKWEYLSEYGDKI
jgi:hypothetical protein